VGEGPGRREKAGIPQDRLFATKPEIAIAQVTKLVSQSRESSATLGFSALTERKTATVIHGGTGPAGGCR
jgi:hypothetical protein